ncbi:hypothetical protein [Mycetohabitans sp. B8]|uniref:hypothetical protein n=1 Tax=Mycetohabitans sp. B8 TaxID=2841845 RepID=UPI0034CE1E33
MARDLRVSIPTAGMLVSGYALVGVACALAVFSFTIKLSAAAIATVFVWGNLSFAVWYRRFRC